MINFSYFAQKFRCMLNWCHITMDTLWFQNYHITPHQAMERIRHKRQHVLLHRPQWNSLIQYHRSLKPSWSNNQIIGTSHTQLDNQSNRSMDISPQPITVWHVKTLYRTRFTFPTTGLLVTIGAVLPDHHYLKQIAYHLATLIWMSQ